MTDYAYCKHFSALFQPRSPFFPQYFSAFQHVCVNNMFISTTGKEGSKRRKKARKRKATMESISARVSHL